MMQDEFTTDQAVATDATTTATDQPAEPTPPALDEAVSEEPTAEEVPAEPQA